MTPWLFLLFALVSATFTWNVFQPVLAPAFPALVSFFAGWLTSELPLHHVAWQMAVTAGFVWVGGLEAWPGWAALVVLSASWCGLLVTQSRARRSREAALHALRDGLGTDYEQRLLPQLRPPQRVLPLRQLFYPFRIRHRDVEVRRNIVFHEEDRFRLRLDVYAHRGRPRGRPMLIFVHGGAWVLGDKERQGLPFVYHLASRGWVCANISYRLSPRATFPDQLVDVKRAIAWVRARGAEYGGDPGFIMIAGASAGGHLASLAALTPNDPEYQPGFEAADMTLQGCVSCYGIYDFLDRHGHWPTDGLRRILERFVMKSSPDAAREAWDRASPVSRIHEGAPPFLLVHGTHDSMVPIDDARRFVEALRRVSRQPVVFAELAGAPHAFGVFPSVRTGITVELVERFGAFARSAHGGGESLEAIV